MFLLLVLFALAEQLAGHTIPSLPSASADNISSHPPLLRAREDVGNPENRSIWDIVRSCLATIAACTWIAVHPNIPGPTDSGWCVFKRRLSTMAYAVIAPELMVTWALHQYLGARQIKDKFNNKILSYRPHKVSKLRHPWNCLKSWFREKEIGGPYTQVPWTNTHGFMMQMGGFMLYEKGVPMEVLTYSRLEELIVSRQVDIPRIHERSINDKSKGDFISKSFVAIQTSWFIVHCGARRATDLPLTELEVVTLAFAVLNAITYILWLDKPQHVREALRIDLKPDTKPANPDTESFKTAPSRFPTREDVTLPEERPVDQHRGWLHRHLLKDYRRFQHPWYRFLWFVIYRVPYRIVSSSLHPMKKLFMHSSTRDTHSNFLRVPMFAKEKLDNADPVLAHYIPCLIGAFFGSLHVIAWSFGTAELEQWLWRGSTLVITIEPLLFAAVKGLTSCRKDPEPGCNTLDVIRYSLISFIWLPFILGLPAYVVARVILLTQAFISLRHLPHEAYLSIPWTTIVPHL